MRTAWKTLSSSNNCLQTEKSASPFGLLCSPSPIPRLSQERVKSLKF